MSNRRQTMCLQALEHEEEDINEEIDQKITFTLQEIDTNFNKCRHVASNILAQIKTYSGYSSALEDKIQVWIRFFNHFVSVEQNLQHQHDDTSTFLDQSSIIQTDDADWPRLSLSQTPMATPHRDSFNRPTFIDESVDFETPNKRPRLSDEISPFSNSDMLATPAPIKSKPQSTPHLNLANLPTAFQEGTASLQLTELYSQFFGDDSQALSLSQLSTRLPDYGSERIELLLDVLVSRKLLRRFTVGGDFFWEMKADDTTADLSFMLE